MHRHAIEVRDPLNGKDEHVHLSVPCLSVLLLLWWAVPAHMCCTCAPEGLDSPNSGSLGFSLFGKE